MKYRLCIVATALLASSTAQAVDRVNPFAKPQQYIRDHSTSVSGTQAPVEFRLKAVMPSGDRPLANINGELIGLGEEYSGFTLRAVSHGGVILARGDERVELLFLPQNRTQQGR